MYTTDGVPIGPVIHRTSYLCHRSPYRSRIITPRSQDAQVDVVVAVGLRMSSIKWTGYYVGAVFYKNAMRELPSIIHKNKLGT